jgi:YidC/Oxa1 family membrane protein insertase
MNARSLLTLALWAIIAWLVFKSCSPKSTPSQEIGLDFHSEDFTDHLAEEELFVLENDLVWTRWSSVGAGCLEVRLKQYTPDLIEGREATEDDWLYLFRAQRGMPPQEGRAGRPENYRKRLGLRMFEAEEVLGSSLDASVWQVESRPEVGELTFSFTTANGVKVTKRVSLPPQAYHFDLDVSVQNSSPDLAGKDLALRLGTGGGIVKEADSFYPNPYAAAGMLEYGQVEEFEKYFPKGSLPSNGRRDMAARWKGDVAYVVEGSKYFLSAIRPTDRLSFNGAVVEVLYDDGAREADILSGLLPEQREKYQAVGRAQQVQHDGQAATLEDVATATGLNVQEVTDISRDLNQRISAVSLQEGPWFQSSYWQRTSVAGDFSLHLGRPGEAPDQASFQWYVGPKDNAILAQHGTLGTVQEFADYGSSFFYRMFFTTYIAPGIMALLGFFHSLVGNWGVAIILLTILVRGSLMPLNRRSQLKMAEYQVKMQKVKPLLDKINKKYAKDAQAKQQATMKLYKQHKVTPPLGGCLPIFLQMPIFIGLFAALRSSTDLRQQPFVSWMKDLSRPDALVNFGGPVADFFPLSAVTSFNLLPIIMVVLWVAHQKSMPKPADPNQAQMQKMMTFMPILFGVMLYNYAAGLSLYMITSSAIGIFEAKVIKKRWPVPTAGRPDDGADKAS